jgi:SAM-dependent methyltransferase
MTTAEFWDNEAKTFDEKPDHGLLDPAIRTAWTELLLPLLPSPPARIADIGCGSGSLSLLFAEAGHRVSGLDFSPKMIELARKKVIVRDTTLISPWETRQTHRGRKRRLMWFSPDTFCGRWMTRIRRSIVGLIFWIMTGD